MKIFYTKHAKEMLSLRKINKDFVNTCIKHPDHVLPGTGNKKVYLKNFGKNYLKVILVHEDKQIVIITLYWIAKLRVKV